MKTRAKQGRKSAPAPQPRLLESAAQAIGSTLGALAVKTGLAKPAPLAKTPSKARATTRKTSVPAARTIAKSRPKRAT